MLGLLFSLLPNGTSLVLLLVLQLSRPTVVPPLFGIPILLGIFSLYVLNAAENKHTFIVHTMANIRMAESDWPVADEEDRKRLEERVRELRKLDRPSHVHSSFLPTIADFASVFNGALLAWYWKADKFETRVVNERISQLFQDCL